MAKIGDGDEIFELAKGRHEPVIGCGYRMLQTAWLGELGARGPLIPFANRGEAWIRGDPLCVRTMTMDDEADAAREYDRLRAELADFVLDALAERMAQGQQPQLSQALVEAIDRRVEEAVAARVGRAEWPDPDSFADSVIAAAAGRAGASGDRGEGSAAKARRTGGDEERGARSQPRRPRRLTSGQIGLLALLGIAIIAAAGYFMMRAWNSPTTNTVVMNVQGNMIEPTPDGGANAQLPPAGTAAPTSAGAPENVQGQPR
jgi:hypothetical protein